MEIQEGTLKQHSREFGEIVGRNKWRLPNLSQVFSKGLLKPHNSMEAVGGVVLFKMACFLRSAPLPEMQPNLKCIPSLLVEMNFD